MTSPLGAELANLWLGDGTVDRVLARRRAEMAERHAIVSRALEGLPFETRPGAYQVWLPLDERASARATAEALQRQGVRVSPAEEFAANGQPPPAALRISLSATPKPADLTRALGVVRRVVEAGSGARTLL